MTIVGVAIVTAVLFLRAMRKMDLEQAELAAISGEGAAPDDGATSGVPWFRRLEWRWEHLVPLSVMLIAAWAAIESSGYPDRARPFPLAISVSALVLAAIQLYDQATHHRTQHSIMDLGMMSPQLQGARGTALVMAGLLSAFLLIGTTVGMKWGAIAFALAVPIVLLRGLGRWPLALLTGGLVYLFVYIVLDNVLFVIWPEPFVGDWLKANVF
jgi:hypothetical protein